MSGRTTMRALLAISVLAEVPHGRTIASTAMRMRYNERARKFGVAEVCSKGHGTFLENLERSGLIERIDSGVRGVACQVKATKYALDTLEWARRVVE